MAKEYGLAEAALSKKDDKPAKKQKKTIKKISHVAAHSGGYAITHEHHSPEHADELHQVPDQAALLSHMEQNQPQAGPQEAEPEAAEPQPGQ